LYHNNPNGIYPIIEVHQNTPTKQGMNSRKADKLKLNDSN